MFKWVGSYIDEKSKEQFEFRNFLEVKSVILCAKRCQFSRLLGVLRDFEKLDHPPILRPNQSPTCFVMQITDDPNWDKNGKGSFSHWIWHWLQQHCVYILSFRNFLVIGLLSINLLILEGQVTFFEGKNLQKLHTSKLGRELKNVHFSRLFKNFREDPFKLTGDELAVIMNKSCYIALLTRTQSVQRWC